MINILRSHISFSGSSLLIFLSGYNFYCYSSALNNFSSSFTQESVIITLVVQALMGAAGTFYISNFKFSSIKNISIRYTFSDRAFFILFIFMLFFNIKTSITLASIFIGLISASIIACSYSLLQFPVLSILSLSSSSQLLFANIFPDLLIIRLGLIIVLLLYLFNYQKLPISPSFSFFSKSSILIQSLYNKASYPLSLYTAATPLLIPIIFGVGESGQLLNLAWKAAFLLENIFNSRILFKSSASTSLPLSFKFSVFYIILASFMILFPFFFLLHVPTFMLLPLLVTIPLSSLFRLQNSKVLFRCNSLRITEHANYFLPGSTLYLFLSFVTVSSGILLPSFQYVSYIVFWILSFLFIRRLYVA